MTVSVAVMYTLLGLCVWAFVEDGIASARDAKQNDCVVVQK